MLPNTIQNINLAPLTFEPTVGKYFRCKWHYETQNVDL